jgi:excinuclease ABC subunit B
MEAHGAKEDAPGAGEGAQRLSPAQAVKKIRRLEQEMHRLARNLEFEEAARLRDEIASLRRQSLGAESERMAG